MNKRLGCLSLGGAVVALLTLLLIAAIGLLFGGQLFSPGPLNTQAGDALGDVRSHAETGGRCSACHVAPWVQETMGDRCVVCHAGVRAQLEDATSLHGALMRADASFQCRDCHPEHRGADAPLTVIDPARFPHQATGYALQGHRQKPNGAAFVCADCHGSTLARFQPDSCSGCHRNLDAVYMQAHEVAFGQACLVCHNGLDTYGAAFDHNDQDFPLQGRHAAVDCVGCHEGARAIADLQAAPQDCYACHATDDAHEGTLGQNCGVCHNASSWQGATVDHAVTAFPLTGAHIEVDCNQCHVDTVFGNAPTDCFSCHADDDAHEGSLGPGCAACHTTETWLGALIDHTLTAFQLTGAHIEVDCAQCHVDRVFKSAPTDCFSCHADDDAHDGSLGTDCAACHTTAGWTPATFDHSQSAFQLTGAHLSVDCAQCHADKLFTGTPADCHACHATDDAHDGSLGTDCAACHTTETWQDVTIDHSLTAFPLTGAHIEVDCAQCHSDKVYKGSPTDCFSCHSDNDPHEGLLGQDCERCHTTDGWAPSIFDHAWSIFQLTGQHLFVDCALCHSDKRLKGVPTDCYSCHAADDAHNGQYGTACAACHTTDGWQPATFDHALSAFPLTGAHVTVACTQCHAHDVFRGTPKDCFSCHGEPGYHVGLLGTDCSACHTTTAWLPAQYNRAHTFPLDHGESGWNPCRTCHPTTLGAYTCYNCHEHDPARIERKHREEGIANFANCVECHPTGREDERNDD